jgi:hypothetical protein
MSRWAIELLDGQLDVVALPKLLGEIRRVFRNDEGRGEARPLAPRAQRVDA